MIKNEENFIKKINELETIVRWQKETISQRDKYIQELEAPKTCNICPNRPEEGESYPMICGECKRFYADQYGIDAEDYE